MAIVEEPRSNPTVGQGKFDDSVNILQAASYNQAHNLASISPSYLTTEAMKAQEKLPFHPH